MLKRFGIFFSGLVLLAATNAALAQQVQLPPLIKIVVPFAAGASTDLTARAVAVQLGRRLGINVIVENRAGGSTFIGAGAVAKSPKDGSMLLYTSVSTVTAAATMRTVPMDINTELAPVALLSEGPLVVVASAKTDIKTPADLVAAARARPDTITYGSAGVGTVSHVAGELLNDAAKIELKHIPYKGTATAMSDFVAGRIDLLVVTSAQPHPAFLGVPGELVTQRFRA